MRIDEQIVKYAHLLDREANFVVGSLDGESHGTYRGASGISLDGNVQKGSRAQTIQKTTAALIADLESYGGPMALRLRDKLKSAFRSDDGCWVFRRELFDDLRRAADDLARLPAWKPKPGTLAEKFEAALRSLGATSEATAQRILDVVAKIGPDEDADKYKRPVQQLKNHGVVGTARGPGGGVWLLE